jgi:murein DD-endopeptidase MepM/ murein hydrolase activator NlpD
MQKFAPHSPRPDGEFQHRHTSRISHARGHNKAIGHLRFKTTKAEQVKGNQFSFLACGVLAILAGLNFTVQDLTTRYTVTQAPPHQQAVQVEPQAAPRSSFAIFGAARELQVPVDGVRVDALSDTWGQARSEGRKHQGIDIMAPQDTPVRATADGRIVRFFDSTRGGITIYQLDERGAYIFYYAHLVRRAWGLAEGDTVRQGQVIGYVGETGNATTPHLHFEIQKMPPPSRGQGPQWWKAEAVNPYPYLLSGEAPK